MSINITFSGKVDKNCRPLHSLLEDPQVLHWEQEKQRRKLRIIQVREKAKHAAKTIRNKVARERKRCLNNYQMKRAEEIRNWRKEQLGKENNAYMTALSQIGQAHRAANEEKNKQNTRKPELQSYKQFKKAMRSTLTKENKPITWDKCTCTEAQKCLDAHTKCACTQTTPIIETKRICGNSNKKIKSISFCDDQKRRENETGEECSDDKNESNCECESETEGANDNEIRCEVPDEDEDICANIIITSDSDSSDSDSDRLIENKCYERNARICKPAIVLDVEVDSQDTIDIMPSYEMKNKLSDRKKQFSSIVRISPKKQNQCQKKQQQCPPKLHKEQQRKKCENIEQNTNTKQAQEKCSSCSSSSSSSSTVSSNEECSSTNESVTATPPATKKITTKKTARKATRCPQTKTNLEKRFSAVTNLIKKQQQPQPTVSKCGDTPSRIGRSKSPKAKQSTATFNINRTPPKKCKSPSSNASNKTPSLKKQKSSCHTFSNLVTPHHQSPRKRCATSTGSGSSKVQFYNFDNPTPKECTPVDYALPNLATSHLSPRKRCATPSSSGRVQFCDYDNKMRNECMPPDYGLSNSEICCESPRKRCTTPCSIGSSVAKVQFYDYHSKISKPYEPTTTITTAKESIVDGHYSKCNAMENALKERELEKQQQEYLLQKNKVTKERGQKALEREQIRRDCNELTEKLEALNRKYPRQNLNCINDPHIFADKGLRKESKLHAVIDEILSKPAIITCPEEQSQQFMHINKPSEPSKCTPKSNVVNLGEKPLGAKSLADYTSSDSCSSLILGYVKDQSKKISTNLDRNDNNDAQQNKETTERLKQLLKRLDDIRECLLSELTCENKADPKEVDRNIDNIIKCLNKVCNEHNITLSGGTKTIQSVQNTKCNYEPVEIVITVKGDHHHVEIPGSKSNKIKKDALKSSSSFDKGIQTKTLRKTPKKKYSKKKPTESPATTAQTLYDSNSTSYRSLPKQISTKMDGLTATSTINNVRPTPSDENDAIPHLNPLIAQYVQRLLGMSHSTIQKLCISSSDVPTPNSTIMNTSTNVCNTSSSPVISEERIICVQKFLEDNRSFVKELEETLRTHNSKVSLGESIEHIWRKRLLLASSADPKALVASNKNNNEVITKAKSTESPQKLKEKKEHCTVVKSYKTSAKRTTNEAKSRKDVLSPQKLQKKQMIDKAIETQCSQMSSGTETARKLTESCAQRITELTELINRVRAEKQRLLEVTLSSISDNGKQSTEYIELPCESESETKISEDPKVKHSPTKNNNLQKTQPFAASRDSGIYESRPATAQDIHLDNTEDSQPSREKPEMTTRSRKPKPPSIIQRLSPELLEDDKQHELSTIPEVDTPGTSHVNVCPPQDSSPTLSVVFKKPEKQLEQPSQPIPFPSFEEYIQKLNLDVSQLDAKQRRLLEQDFCHYLELLAQSQKQPHYKEFPSLKTYMKKCGWGENITISEASSTTSDEKMPHISTITPQLELSKSCEYTLSVVKSHRVEQSSNSTDINDSSSIDIEAELKRRNIMKHPFCIEPQRSENMIESGIDKLSSSCSTIEKLEQSLMRLVMQWPENCLNKSQSNCELDDARSETTTTSSLRKKKRITYTSSLKNKCGQAKGGGSQGLNLRDFLTKELLKQANLSASTSTITEDSLCSQFLHSIIGSLSPRPDAVTMTKRQRVEEGLNIRKTSTPVGSTGVSHPSTSLKLFTGESCYSSVKPSISDDDGDKDGIECGDQADKSSS